MSSSAITTQVAQLKVGNVQNQADSSGVYSAGAWDFKNASAVTSVKIDNSGNVGIGTTSPADILHLGGATNKQVRIDTADSVPVYIGGYNEILNLAVNRRTVDGAIGNVNRSAAFISLNGPSGGSNITFNTAAANNTQPTERMRIDSSGNVGIGMAPFSVVALDVKEPDAGQDLILGLTAGTGARAQIRSIAQPDNTSSALSFATTSGGASGERMRIDASGRVGINTTANTNEQFAIKTPTNYYALAAYTAAGTAFLQVEGDSTGITPQISGILRLAKNSTNSRSINASGTINANGADYAEYMTKAGDFVIAKGDICGVNSEGKLTKTFSEAVAFMVKSTNPSFVGGDSWGADLEAGSEELEAARQLVDRIAFCGQVPVNVLGATPGQWIIPVEDNGEIKGEAVSSPSFEQYQKAVGKVIAIEDDGRARIIVKIA